MEKYCMYCGTQINEGETKCSKCGAEIENNVINNNKETEEKAIAENVIENSASTIEANSTNETSNNQTVEKAETNGSAIGSFVCSLCGLLFAGIIFGIIAICLGASAKNQIKEKNQKGNGFATAGIIIGIIDIVFVAIYIVFTFIIPKIH